MDGQASPKGRHYVKAYYTNFKSSILIASASAQTHQAGQKLHTSAASIVDSVQDCRVRSSQRTFAQSGSAKRLSLRSLQIQFLNHREYPECQNTASTKSSVLVEVIKVLGQCQADTLYNTAVDLAVGNQLVGYGTAVTNGGEQP